MNHKQSTSESQSLPLHIYPTPTLLPSFLTQRFKKPGLGTTDAIVST